MQCHPSTQYIIMLGSEQKLLSYKSNLEDAELNTLSSIAVELNIKLDWTCELQSWMIGTKRLAALMSISLCHHCICSKAIKVNYCERTSDEIYTRNDWKLALDVHTQRLFIGIKIKNFQYFAKKLTTPLTLSAHNIRYSSSNSSYIGLGKTLHESATEYGNGQLIEGYN